MSWNSSPDPQQPTGTPPSRPGDPNWVQVPPDQWPGSAPATGGFPPTQQPQGGFPMQTPYAPAGYQSAPQQAAYRGPVPYLAPKRRGCLGGLGCLIALIVIVSVVVPLVIIAFSFGAFNSAGGGDMFSNLGDAFNAVLNVNETLGISTTAFTGDAANFDPFAQLGEVMAFAGEGAQLAEIEAVQVRSDGTQNLTATYDAPRPRTTYTFFREVERPENAPPVGAGGTTEGPWYEPITVEAYRPGEMSQIRQTGGGMSISTQFTNQGLKRQTQDPTTNLAFFEGFVEAPKCTTRALWNVALEHGAQAEAVATITYNGSGYEFTIPGAGVFLEFDANCRLQG